MNNDDSKTYSVSPTSIRLLNDDDKPRERAIKYGIGALSLAELLAIILGTGGMVGKSVLDLSREILSSVNYSVSELSKISIKDLCKRYKGVGEAKAVSLAASLALARHLQLEDRDNSKPLVVTDPSVAYNYIRYEIESLPHEEFWIITLNRANHIKSRHRISQGGTAATVVDIKMLAKEAIDQLAHGLILVHNHPSGNLKPSIEDDNLTKRIAAALQTLDIRLLDHLIISSRGYYSYHDSGKI